MSSDKHTCRPNELLSQAWHKTVNSCLSVPYSKPPFLLLSFAFWGAESRLLFGNLPSCFEEMWRSSNCSRKGSSFQHCHQHSATGCECEGAIPERASSLAPLLRHRFGLRGPAHSPLHALTLEKKRPFRKSPVAKHSIPAHPHILLQHVHPEPPEARECPVS